MKHLHRLIVTSDAYTRASTVAGAEEPLVRDPDNLLAWRRQPIRLEAQVIRDCVLATAGMLDVTAGGPPVLPAEQTASRRRSLYFWHSDISRNLFLTTFDDAGVKECYRREESIVPQQALALSNAELVHEASAAVAAEVAGAIGSGPDGDEADETRFLHAVFARVLLRGPTSDECRACKEAIDAWRAIEPDITREALRSRLVWALFNHNDFVTLR
jgi:hypothetical protein